MAEDTIINIPNDVSIEAVVNSGLVCLYSPDGKEILVDPSSADVLIQMGFTRIRLDPSEIIVALDNQLDALHSAVDDFIEGVQNSQYVRALAVTMHTTFDLVAGTIAALDSVAYQLYNTVEDLSVEMQDANGNVIRVDPGQVELYQSEPHNYTVKQ